MTANRIPPTLSNTPLGVGGSTYASRISEEIIALYASRVNQVTSVAGTNTITGVCTPALTSGYQHGETFRFTPVANNTGPVTLNWDGKGAADLRSNDNQNLAADDLVSGIPVEVWYDATISDFRLMDMTEAQVQAAVGQSAYVLLGHQTVTSAITFFELGFTADVYSAIKFIGSNISSANNSVSMNPSLRYASGVILDITIGGGGISASNFNGFSAEFIIDRQGGSSRRPFATYSGFFNNSTGATPATVASGSASANVPDRVRFAFSSGNIDAGEFWAYGLVA